MVYRLLYLIDPILYIYVIITVLYMLVFALASIRRDDIGYVKKNFKTGRFLFLTTATSYDIHLERTIKSILAQEYDEKMFDLIVVTHNMSSVMNMKIAQYKLTLLRMESATANKVQALQYAVKNMPPLKLYDMVILLDPDETIGVNFLNELNKAYQSGSKMIQAHRIDRSKRDYITTLGATFEEINNSIFRIGHNNLGYSSALIGSGLCAEFNWFRENIDKLRSDCEEKEMEIQLVQQKVYVDYMDNLQVYVERPNSIKTFNAQHRRWYKDQKENLKLNYRKFLPALLNKNYDLADKILQWMLMPRIPLVGIITLMSVICPLVYWTMALKWWIAANLLLVAFALGTPDYLVDKEWKKAFRLTPIIVVNSFASLFTNLKLTQTIRKGVKFRKKTK